MPESSTSQKKTSTVLEAIILALMIHVVLLTSIYFSDIGMFSLNKEDAHTEDISMEFIELTEELLALQEIPDEPDIAALLEKYKNVTSKENTPQNDEVKSYSFNKNRVDEQVLEELLKMEQEEFEKLKKEGAIPTDLGKNSEDEPKKIKRKLDANTSSNANSYSAATSNYDFSRNHELKKDPAYKCRLFGQIIVEISVNRDGEVISAKGISGDLEKDCLLEESVNYAKRWKFRAKHDAPKSEKGTITFTFMPQD